MTAVHTINDVWLARKRDREAKDAVQAPAERDVSVGKKGGQKLPPRKRPNQQEAVMVRCLPSMAGLEFLRLRPQMGVCHPWAGQSS